MFHSLRGLSQEGPRPAVDLAGAGYRRGDLGWAAAGGADAAVSGGVTAAIAHSWSPRALD
jgi:hypothetical protein